MKYRRVVVSCLIVGLAATACKASSSPGASPDDTPTPAPDPGPAPAPKAIDPAYLADFENLCHSEQRSGADRDDTGNRTVTIAMWLGENVKTQGGRDFLAKFSRTQPDQKAALLESERARLGLDECPLIATWTNR